jgi:transposase-like protein
MFEGGESTDRSALIRESVRLMIEEALEAEVSEALGRGYFEHGASGGAHRNGYRRGKLQAAEGVIEYGVPQVRGPSGWRSEVRAAVGRKSEELERLAFEMFARGLSRMLTLPPNPLLSGRCRNCESRRGRGHLSLPGP